MSFVELNKSTVTVKKDELLAEIRKNRAKHQEIYEDAKAGYFDAVIDMLEDKVDLAREESSDLNLYEINTLVYPVNHTKDYDRVIRMLEMSTADDVTISETQFSNYVLDEWAWKQEFISTSSNYTNTKR